MKIKNPKKVLKIYKTLTKTFKSFDAIVDTARTSSYFTLSFTGNAFIVIPVSTGVACGLTIGNKVIKEIVMQKYFQYKKQNGKDQQTMKLFDKLYRKSLQDNIIRKDEIESLCNIFTKFLDETKKESFLQI